MLLQFGSIWKMSFLTPSNLPHIIPYPLMKVIKDINTVEEMSVCARWVPPKGMPVEHFLGCLPLKRLTAELISETAVNFFKERGKIKIVC
jgi:hypothetical protein